MPLMFLLVAPALAARVYWVAQPSEADTAAVARTVPEATFAPLDALMGNTEALNGPDPAVAKLREEVGATRPLFEVFDGELQIMARLDKAVSDVRVVRSLDERNVLWSAYLNQGYAVQRYFQDKVGTDPGAAPYRLGSGPGATILSWSHAAALVDAPTPSETDLPDAAARVAYDAVQASVRAMPSVTFVVGPLARGAEVYVDGKRLTGTGDRVLAVPGRHWAHIEAGGRLLAYQATTTPAGTTVTLTAPFGPAERDELVTLVRNAGAGWTVPAAAQEIVAAAKEPVYVAVPGEGKPQLLRLDSGTATATRIKADETAGGGLTARVAVGAGWASSGDWFLQNVDAGAPYTESTVNAATPSVAVGAGWRAGWFYAGAGVDVNIPLGEWHALPTGDTTTRPFVHPHVDVGIPYVQLTAGPQFPWYLGIGLQAEAPIVGPLELYGRGVYGIGLNQPRTDGAPTFEPLDTWTAWLGASLRFGG